MQAFCQAQDYGAIVKEKKKKQSENMIFLNELVDLLDIKFLEL